MGMNLVLKGYTVCMKMAIWILPNHLLIKSRKNGSIKLRGICAVHSSMSSGKTARLSTDRIMSLFSSIGCGTKTSRAKISWTRIQRRSSTRPRSIRATNPSEKYLMKSGTLFFKHRVYICLNIRHQNTNKSGILSWCFASTIVDIPKYTLDISDSGLCPPK